MPADQTPAQSGSEERWYAIGVLLGPDGTNALKVIRSDGEHVYSTSVIGGDQAGWKLSMTRAADAMWKDVRVGGERRRASYPPAAFGRGRFTRAEEA